jgi:hypothetical protein
LISGLLHCISFSFFYSIQNSLINIIITASSFILLIFLAFDNDLLKCQISSATRSKNKKEKGKEIKNESNFTLLFTHAMSQAAH